MVGTCNDCLTDTVDATADHTKTAAAESKSSSADGDQSRSLNGKLTDTSEYFVEVTPYQTKLSKLITASVFLYVTDQSLHFVAVPE